MIPIRRRVLKLWLACGLMALRLSADQIALLWNGGPGNGCAPANWTPSALPTNTATTTYYPQIGSGASNLVNLDIAATVDALYLGHSATLSTQAGGSLVLGVLNNFGTIDINFSGRIVAGEVDVD